MNRERRQQLSLQRQLTRMVVLTTGASLFCAALAFVTYDFVTLRAAMARDAETLAAVVGVNSSAALASEDARTATEILAGLQAAGPVRAAVIYDSRSREFARWISPDAGALALPRVPPEWGHHFLDGRLELTQPIDFAGKRVGALHLRWDTAQLSARIERTVAIGLLVFGIAAGVSTLALWRIRRQVSQPLAQLTEGSRSRGCWRSHPAHGRVGAGRDRRPGPHLRRHGSGPARAGRRGAAEQPRRQRGGGTRGRERRGLRKHEGNLGKALDM